MPESDGGSPIEAARLPEANAPEPEFVRDESGVEVAYRGKVSPTEHRIKSGPLSYGRVEHFGDGIRGPSRATTYRAPDLMVTMLGHGTIDQDMAAAGRAFRSNFEKANLDSLKALDLRRIPGQSAPMTETQWVEHRQAVAVIGETMEALGGFNTPVACAAWFVLGCGLSIREWARRERFGRGGHLSEATARRLVHGALEILVELERERRR